MTWVPTPTPPGSSRPHITSLEAFETVTQHSRLELDEAAEVLAHMTGVLLRN
jgi:hypothetical protein